MASSQVAGRSTSFSRIMGWVRRGPVVFAMNETPCAATAREETILHGRLGRQALQVGCDPLTACGGAGQELGGIVGGEGVRIGERGVGSDEFVKIGQVLVGGGGVLD